MAHAGRHASLLHGIINLLMPLFIYDLASLLVAAISAASYKPWLAFWPMTDPAVAAVRV